MYYYKICKIRGGLEAVGHLLTVRAMVVNSMPTRGNNLFSFPRSGNETKHGVKFHCIARNTEYFENLTECGVQSVLTIGSYCLPYASYVWDTA